MLHRTLVLVAATAVLAGPVVTADPAPAAAPHGTVRITDYGARAGDGVDDLPAITRAIADAKAHHRTVVVPRGTFDVHGLVHLDGVALAGTGTASVLRATDPALQAVRVEGAAASVKDLTLSTVPVTQRLSTDESARIMVAPGATGFSITGVTVTGASSAGMIVFGTDGVIERNTVRDTLADGIHITGASADVEVSRNRVIDTGDDQIAVVSYERSGLVTGVDISRNDVSGGHARGITVSGGKDIDVDRNSVADTAGAGIYLASEGSYRTLAVDGIRVTRNTVERDSQRASVPESGGIRIQATYQDPSVRGAVIERNVLRDSAANGITIVGSTGVEADLERNTISGAAGYGIRISAGISGTIGVSRNSIARTGSAPFSNASSATVTSDLPNDPNAGDGGSDQTYSAAQGSPTIDGTVDGLWDQASPLVMNTDANGTGGVARVAWDRQNLYVLFQMTDATPSVAASNENNDSVEVWVDQLHLRNGTRTTGDYQLRVDRAGALSTVIDGFDVSTVRRAVVDTATGYTVEMAIPFTDLSPTAGDVIGFNASANDDADDDGVRDTYISWVDRSLPYYADTRDYGDVVLAPAP